MGRVVAEAKKNQKEVVRVETAEYQGHDLFAIRVYTVNGDPVGGKGDYYPSKKGITLRLDMLPWLIKSLHEVANIPRREMVEEANRRNEATAAGI